MTLQEDTLSSRIPVVLVGAGRIGHAVYLPLLHTRPEWALLAVVEPDPAHRHVLSTRYPSVPVVQNLSDLPKHAVAAICATPWFTHADVVAECLRLGLHVLCEKPVSLDLDEITDLQKAEARAGLPVAVGYMKRHAAPVNDFLDAARTSPTRHRELSVRILDPNAPHQVAHLVPPGLTRRPGLPDPAAARLAQLAGSACDDRQYALAHGLGGSLVHQVNVVQALLSQDGDRLLGSLGYASQWADGTAVSCGWRPRPDLMVQMTHLRVPRHHRYREEWELVTEDARLRLQLPSPYAQEDNGELRTTRWDARGAETTTICRRDDAPPAFTAQLAAWARAIQGTAAPLPGLTDASADAAVVLEAARNLA